MKLLQLSVLLSLPKLSFSYFWRWSARPFVEEDFVNSADFIFKAETDLDVSVEDCFDIVSKPQSYEFWHDEVTNLEIEEQPGPNGTGKIQFDFSDRVLNIVMFGPIGFRGEYDVWEPDGDTRRVGFWVPEMRVPTWYSYTAVRDEYICKEITNTTSKLTRTLGADAGFFARWNPWVARRRMRRIVEEFCPERLVQAIKDGELPIAP
jgi:hypothetical protein